MTRALLVAVAALTLGACGDSDPSPPTARDLAGVDLSPDHTITVDEDGYEPGELRVEVGEVILLVNEGDASHSFTADDQRFDTGRMLPGEETTLVLTEPSQSRFFDVEEPDHDGTLTVVEAQ